MDTGEVLLQAIRHYGEALQKMVAIEEMTELQKELCKNFRGEDNITHIAEEIADVEIMMEQLKIIFDCKASADLWRDYKLDRLERRIYGAGAL